MNNTTIVMDVKAVAELLQVKPQTIYSWITISKFLIKFIVN